MYLNDRRDFPSLNSGQPCLAPFYGVGKHRLSVYLILPNAGLENPVYRGIIPTITIGGTFPPMNSSGTGNAVSHDRRDIPVPLPSQCNPREVIPSFFCHCERKRGNPFEIPHGACTEPMRSIRNDTLCQIASSLHSSQ